VSATTSSDIIEARLLDHEHQRIRAGLSGLEEVITHVHRMSRPEVVDGVVRTLEWLRREILPHASWEEAWLYPKLDEEAGTAWATRALRFEHEQIRELATALENEFELAHQRWSSEVAFRLVAALARLDSLIKAHLAQEERFVLPLVH
jgi:iron-sulfur cluster repair protein YtfE (RIC family)